MERAQSGLQHVMRSLLAEMPVAEAVLRAWPLVCGPAVSDRTEALSFADGVLRIRVESREWLATLREMAGTYLAGLRGHCGAGSGVQRIEFVLPEGDAGSTAAADVQPGLNWVRTRR